MNIYDLNERYYQLFYDIKGTLKNTLKQLGGSYYFIAEGDIDDTNISDFDPPIVYAYSYNFNEGNYLITSLQIKNDDVEIYGVLQSLKAFEGKYNKNDTVNLSCIDIRDLLYILECISLVNFPHK